MTKQSKITAETAVTNKTQLIALSDTYVSEHNPRFNEEIDEDSI